MKTFVINLKKNVERMNKISTRLKRLGIQYERIEAVYGRILNSSEKKKLVNYFHWWAERGCKPRDGEIGCALSHLNVYRKIVDEQLPFALVLEDDAAMDERLPEQMVRIEKFISTQGPCVVQLSNYSKEHETHWCIKQSSGDSSTEAYIINRTAAEAILRINVPIYAPADSWRTWVAKELFTFYHAFPTVIYPEWASDTGYQSDVTPDNTVVTSTKKMGLLAKIGWTINRLAGLICGRILYHD